MNITQIIKNISTSMVSKDSSTGAAYMPSGTTAQRPVTPVNGYMRYNSDLLAMEAYVNGAWGSTGTPIETSIHSAPSKTTPIDADEIALVDSTATFGLKKLTWANLKATLLTSPILTGTPTAPTPTVGDNSTKISTTAFVTSALDNKMKLMTSVSSTSGTSIDFTGIPSWAKRITVMFNGVSTSGASIIQVQLGTASGVETTGYVSLVSSSGAATTSSSTVGILASALSNAGYVQTGLVTICAMGSNLYVSSQLTVTDVTLGNFSSSGAGRKTTSGTLDRIRITTVNGTDTFDAGSINIMYEG